MKPTLCPGDLLLVRHGAPVVADDVVVVRLPDRTIAVKRAAFRHGAGWWVTRDNPRQGVDSALVGEITAADVLAVAKLRLWPKPGRIPGAPPTR